MAGLPSNSAADSMLTLPPFRVNLSATTTYYLNMQTTHTAGTSLGYGRLTAVRVG